MSREREQFMDEHNHGGAPSYFASVHLHCRHDGCYGAMREYKSPRSPPAPTALPSMMLLRLGRKGGELARSACLSPVVDGAVG